MGAVSLMSRLKVGNWAAFWSATGLKLVSIVLRRQDDYERT